MRLVNPVVHIGSDPELFITDGDGNVVPSSKVIPNTGTKWPTVARERAEVVRDGVQIELNTSADSCRQISSYYISMSLAALARRLDELKLEGKEYKVSKAGVIELSPDLMKTLDKKDLEFGCKPSFNIYDSNARVDVKGTEYKFRSGAGHVHLGALPPTIWNPGLESKWRPKVDRREELVMLLDIVLGNTCVMIDQDPMQKERRKHYGRAGEYRLPDHGLEYRPLSNFWLRSYPLASFVFGMARYAVMILHSSNIYCWEDAADGAQAYPYATELIDSVDPRKIRKAINENDVELAKENFKALEAFIKKYAAWSTKKYSVRDMPLNALRLIYFKNFIADIEARGLDAIFPEGILEAWTTTGSDGPRPVLTTADSVYGWEQWLDKNYKPSVEKLAKKLEG